MTPQLRIVDEPRTIDPAADAEISEQVAAPNPDIDADDVEVAQVAGVYDDASEPDWDAFDRRTGAFIKALLPAVDKDEYLDDRGRIHHFEQLEALRLVDQLDDQDSDDVDLAALFALPDESLLFVGSDPTAKNTSPLFGFVVEPVAPVPAPASAREALDLLRPGAVRDAFAEGDDPDRQGEWWLLPTREVPVSTRFTPGVSDRPFGPSPLATHVPREWGMTVSDEAFVADVRDRVDELPASIETPPEVIEWTRRQHQRVPAPDHVPSWETIQAAAGDVLVRGTLRHRENDHYVEDLGETWHRAETHSMDVYTGDDVGRVVLD